MSLGGVGPSRAMLADYARLMHFCLVDCIMERTEDSAVTLKHVTMAEEYLLDHFPGFPVLPGVMMLEAMIQAGRLLASDDEPLVLGKVSALKYGAMVRPGDGLLVSVRLASGRRGQELDIKAEAKRLAPGQTHDDPDAQRAASGRLLLRPVRVASAT